MKTLFDVSDLSISTGPEDLDITIKDINGTPIAVDQISASLYKKGDVGMFNYSNLIYADLEPESDSTGHYYVEIIVGTDFIFTGEYKLTWSVKRDSEHNLTAYSSFFTVVA